MEINGEIFNRGYKTEELPFTGNGFAGRADNKNQSIDSTTENDSFNTENNTAR